MSSKTVLVALQEKPFALEMIGLLSVKDVRIIFVDNVLNAITQVRETQFDLIILGDRLGRRGTTYDVGMEIKASQRNKHTPVICVGAQSARAMSLVNLLRPYAMRADPKEKDFTSKIVTWLSNVTAPVEKK
jgi:hypothetical protein